MMKMLSRNLQNNGDEFYGGLWKDGAGEGCGSGEQGQKNWINRIHSDKKE